MGNYFYPHYVFNTFEEVEKFLQEKIDQFILDSDMIRQDIDETNYRKLFYDNFQLISGLNDDPINKLIKNNEKFVVMAKPALNRIRMTDTQKNQIKFLLNRFGTLFRDNREEYMKKIRKIDQDMNDVRGSKRRTNRETRTSFVPEIRYEI